MSVHPEISVGMGFGYGGGGGTGMVDNDESATKLPGTVGYGGGGGREGTSASRHIAAIEFGPDRVRVEPITDPTKAALAFFTMLVSMLSMMAKMRSKSR